MARARGAARGRWRWRARPTARAERSCSSGFLVNATNPKGLLFMLAVLPQFIVPARPQFSQYAICAARLSSPTSS